MVEVLPYQVKQATLFSDGGSEWEDSPINRSQERRCRLKHDQRKIKRAWTKVSRHYTHRYGTDPRAISAPLLVHMPWSIGKRRPLNSVGWRRILRM